MILLENRNYLRLHNRPLLERLGQMEERQTRVVTEQAKDGEMTLKIKTDQGYQYVHSRYNPLREAESLVSALGNIEKFDHVLFIGAGLGYIIKAFASAYPDKKLSVYEWDDAVLEQFLSEQDLSGRWAGPIEWISDNQQEVLASVKRSIDKTGAQFFFYVLPFYERHYAKEINQFLNLLKESLIEKKAAMATDFSFQQRWVVNAVKNFPKLTATPNVLMDVDRSVFKGKAAVLIAAGPSLNEEFENLKKIKKEGSAYLFAVGSAINALLKQDIIPDAVCSYDPTPMNQRVIQIVKDRHLSELPLIFGSTIGFETLTDYPGPMLHVINIQDTLAPLLLKRKDSRPIEAVNDAPSIAVITLQMLLRLGADPIILAGQNLAYLDDRFYARGISAEGDSGQLSENAKEAAITVKSVDGTTILTSRSYDSMRRQIELYLQAAPERHVFNTTSGGAAIAGAPFIPLHQLMKELKPDTVRGGWYDCRNQYDRPIIPDKIERVLRKGSELNESFEKILKSLRQLKKSADRGEEAGQITAKIEKVNHYLRKMQKNGFYQSLIVPMMRVQTEHFNKVAETIRGIGDPLQKAETILKEIDVFLNECIMNGRLIFSAVSDLQKELKK